jgi:branched-chain amino acid transport system permease protein
MLYSLIALGFVLIFKASGVFNFAQGVMVLFAALAMARFAQWVPQLIGVTTSCSLNAIAFVGALGADDRARLADRDGWCSAASSTRKASRC